MYKNNENPKTIPHKLFKLKVPADPDKHEYDLILSNGIIDGEPIIPNDWELCIFLYDKMYLSNKPGFNIPACLDYHYNFSENKEFFLDRVKEGLVMQHLDWPQDPYHEYTHQKVLSWFDKKTNESTTFDSNNGPDKVSHKIALLFELGIIDGLRKEYFSLQQSERNETDLAKLIAVIIGENDKTESIRRAISGIKTGKKNDPATSPAIRQIKNYLATFNIDIKRLTDPD